MTGVDLTQSSIEEAVTLGRKRLWAQLGARQIGLAATIALAGPVVLLAIGAGYFPAAGLWLFTLAGAACGVYLWRRSRAGAYQVARILDDRFATEDQISTAYYFSHSEWRDEPPIGEQRALAARALAGRSVEEALPWEAPRTAWWAAGMFALAAALLLARLAMQPTLSLEPPLTSVLFPDLAESRQARLIEEQAVDPEAGREGEESAALERQQLAEARPPSERPTPPALAAGDDPGADEDAFEMPEVEGLSIDAEQGDELSFDSEGEQGASEGSPDEKGSKIGGEEGEQPDPTGDWSEESNSMLERLKDAFEKMVENMSMDSPEGSQTAGEESGESTQESESAEQGEQSQAEAEAGEHGTDAEMEGGEPGEGEPQQAAQGGGANDSEQGSNEGQSTAASGTAEGDKQIAEEAARQEAELDALEEFYMERADQLAGEIMVETTVGEQQSARTPLRSVESRHADRGGLVSRDEVPAAYRQYVETYFERIRSQQR